MSIPSLWPLSINNRRHSEAHLSRWVGSLPPPLGSLAVGACVVGGFCGIQVFGSHPTCPTRDSELRWDSPASATSCRREGISRHGEVARADGAWASTSFRLRVSTVRGVIQIGMSSIQSSQRVSVKNYTFLLASHRQRALPCPSKERERDRGFGCEPCPTLSRVHVPPGQRVGTGYVPVRCPTEMPKKPVPDAPGTKINPCPMP
jgi:hypothetical protein